MNIRGNQNKINIKSHSHWIFKYQFVNLFNNLDKNRNRWCFMRITSYKCMCKSNKTRKVLSVVIYQFLFGILSIWRQCHSRKEFFLLLERFIGEMKRNKWECWLAVSVNWIILSLIMYIFLTFILVFSKFRIKTHAHTLMYIFLNITPWDKLS